ncbi:hypothetical protein GW916_07245 [bacterium]|nr:hypothetical protein [bacterium]
MAAIISTASDAITYLNSLYESDSSEPSSGDEDFTVWLSLLNIAINIWEQEEGVLWKELFVKLADAADGDKTTSAGDTSYTCPTDFKFPASGYVWLGSGTNKTPYKVLSQERIQVAENDSSNWCYFLLDGSPTLEFNPNLTIPADYTISYNYYKNATKLTAGSSTFEMSDPMFAVYYALSELKKDEGDTSALSIATQKLEGMRTRNFTPAFSQESTEYSPSDDGFGL